jgi:hypothetical protein
VKRSSKLLFDLLLCRKDKYILQKLTLKIKQSVIQLTINQFFFKNSKVEVQTNRFLAVAHLGAGQFKAGTVVFAWTSK